MSLEDARAFLRKLAHDNGFRREAEAVLTADQFWALIARHGLAFTREEFLVAQQDQTEEDQPPEAGHGARPCLDALATSSRKDR